MLITDGPTEGVHFDTISKMHAEANSYIRIAQWMNMQGHSW